MGEIADDMIDGTTCSICGQFFQEEEELYTHGYPVVCWECWNRLSKQEKRQYQRAERPTL